MNKGDNYSSINDDKRPSHNTPNIDCNDNDEPNEDDNNNSNNNNNNTNTTVQTNNPQENNNLTSSSNNNNNLITLAQLFSSTENDEEEEIIEEDDTGVIQTNSASASLESSQSSQSSQTLNVSVNSLNINTSNSNININNINNNNNNNNNNNTASSSSSIITADIVNLSIAQQAINTINTLNLPNALQLNLSHLTPFIQTLPPHHQVQIQSYINQQSAIIYKQYQINASQMIQKHQQEEIQFQTQHAKSPNFQSSLANLRQTHNLQKQKILQTYHQQKQVFLASLQEKIPAFATKVKNDESSLRISSELFTTETLNPHTDFFNHTQDPNTIINSELSQSPQNLFHPSNSSTIQITPIAGLLFNAQQNTTPLPVTPSAPFLKFPSSSPGIITPMSSSLSKSKSETEWSLLERSKYQRALVRHGPDFSLLSQAIGTKRSGIVKKFYSDQGGARGPENKILLNAYHHLKRIDQLDRFPAELQQSDYEAIKMGTLPKLNLSFLNTPPNSNSNSREFITNTNSNTTTTTTTNTDSLNTNFNTNTNTNINTNTNTVTNTNSNASTSTSTSTNLEEEGEREREREREDEEVDVDPTEKMNETEKKMYKRTRATQILKANNRGIFYIEDDSENFITSLLEKKKRIKKPTLTS